MNEVSYILCDGQTYSVYLFVEFPQILEYLFANLLLYYKSGSKNIDWCLKISKIMFVYIMFYPENRWQIKFKSIK